jgi:hypothetical protein
MIVQKKFSNLQMDWEGFSVVDFICEIKTLSTLKLSLASYPKKENHSSTNHKCFIT